jgi:thiamine phosphate synthase YjbQ (UPF0047 family)
MLHQHSFEVATSGRGTYDVTDHVQRAVARGGVERGLCNVFIHHTSASLMLCENADPAVRHDMSAHVRSVLTHSMLSIPVVDGRCALGIWQGVYVWEHRQSPFRRRLTITVLGE